VFAKKAIQTPAGAAPQQNFNFNTPAYCDSFGVINNVSVLFNNKAGLLSNLNTESLYNMSVKNGLYSVNWPQWMCQTYVPPSTYFVQADAAPFLNVLRAGPGSPLCISATDLSMNEELTAGCLGSFNLQMTVSVVNPLPYVQYYTLFIVVVSEGMLTYDTTRGLFLAQKQISIAIYGIGILLIC
jgi:hypothetical protein